jgi:hypothetical protein
LHTSKIAITHPTFPFAHLQLENQDSEQCIASLELPSALANLSAFGLADSWPVFLFVFQQTPRSSSGAARRVRASSQSSCIQDHHLDSKARKRKNSSQRSLVTPLALTLEARPYHIGPPLLQPRSGFTRFSPSSIEVTGFLALPICLICSDSPPFLILSNPPTVMTTEIIYRERRRRYQWPELQLNLWIFIVLIAASTCLGIFAWFMTVQTQMRLGIPW